MKKKILLLIFFVLSSIIFTSCSKNDSIILFNTEQINQFNALKDTKIFTEEQKIYYLFIAPKKIDTDFIRVQIFKLNDKVPYGGYEVLRTKDYRLMLDERYYHSNYFVLYEKGHYILQIFSHNNLQKPMAYNDFYIK